MNTMKGAARRVATTAGPADSELQGQAYENQDAESRVSPLERAAEVLLLLAVYPLSTTARIGFIALLDRRLRRAYEGVRR